MNRNSLRSASFIVAFFLFSFTVTCALLNKCVVNLRYESRFTFFDQEFNAPHDKICQCRQSTRLKIQRRFGQP
jgi:hypothetical protein